MAGGNAPYPARFTQVTKGREDVRRTLRVFIDIGFIGSLPLGDRFGMRRLCEL